MILPEFEFLGILGLFLGAFTGICIIIYITLEKKGKNEDDHTKR